MSVGRQAERRAQVRSGLDHYHFSAGRRGSSFSEAELMQ